MALTDKPEPKEEPKETRIETDAILPSDIPPPLRRIVTAEEAEKLKEFFARPAREPNEALKAAVRRARKMMAERLEP